MLINKTRLPKSTIGDEIKKENVIPKGSPALVKPMNSGIEEVIYPVDRRNEASKKIALFYGGKFCGRHEEKTPDGRTLYIEKYIIDLKEKTLLF